MTKIITDDHDLKLIQGVDRLNPGPWMVLFGECSCGMTFGAPKDAADRAVTIADAWRKHVDEEAALIDRLSVPPTPQADPETEEPVLGLGQTRWHSSDDCGPDVGIEIGLADGKRLWVGQITTRAWEELDGGTNDLPGFGVDGWWLVVYPDGLPLAKFADVESGREFADVITAALLAGRQPSTTPAPAVDDAVIGPPVAPYSIRDDFGSGRRYWVLGPDADEDWRFQSNKRAISARDRLNIAFNAGVQTERDAARQNQEGAAGQLRNRNPIDGPSGVIDPSFAPWLAENYLRVQIEADAAKAKPALMPWPDRSVTPFLPWGTDLARRWSFKPRFPTLGSHLFFYADEQTQAFLAEHLRILPRWLAERFPDPDDGRFIDWVRQHIELAEEELPF